MSERHLSPLESRNLFSSALPGIIDPGTIESFNGVKIDASGFPTSPVIVQKTGTGPKVALPILRDGVVTATATTGADSLKVERRDGVDSTSTLPGIVFFDGVESENSGVQIFGSVADAVAGIPEISASLSSALSSLQSTRNVLASIGADTTVLDARIAEIKISFQSVLDSLNKTLTSSFVRVTLEGQYDAYFLASEVTDVRVDAGSGNDTIVSTLATKARVKLIGGNGNDTLTAAGSANLIGGSGNDRLTVGTASQLEGGAGNDMLIGSSQSDTLLGGTGKDTYDLSRNAAGVVDVFETPSGAASSRAVFISKTSPTADLRSVAFSIRPIDLSSL